MSMFSMPERLQSDVKSLETMRSEMSETLTREMSSAVKLLAQPVAGAAAMSALGTGLAFHALGVWMGAMTGAAQAAQRLYSPIYDELPGDPASFAGKPRSPATKATSTTKRMIDEARSAAEEIVSGGEIAEPKPAADVALKSAPAPVEQKATAELMPEDFHQPKAMEKPSEPDDLKAIAGIGPKLEAVLNGLGVWTYGQIAEWGAAEIAWVDDYLSFKGRIARDDWIAQAKALAAGTKQ